MTMGRMTNAASELAKLLDCACLFWPFSFDHILTPSLKRRSLEQQQRRARDEGFCPAASHILGLSPAKGIEEYLILLSVCETWILSPES